MRLRVTHRTTYAYGEPVSTSHHEAHLAPRNDGGQRCLFHEVELDPAPATRRERLDYHGNRTLHFAIQEPHRTLDIVATSLVEVPLAADPEPSGGPSWEDVRLAVRAHRDRAALEALSFTFESPHVRLFDELVALARPSFSPGRPHVEAARDLCRRIHDEFVYDPRATDVSTPVSEVLRRKRGVCQDFAHLQIACLRALGLPARYVSGYLLTRPPPGKPRLVGADASHAWISTWVPDRGWIELDPTNDVVPSDEHVRVAYGRDFSDVTPVRGVILGGGRHDLTVSVDVEPLSVAEGDLRAHG